MIRKYLILIFVIVFNTVQAQELIGLEHAVKICLENNYEIQIANNNLEVAGNNQSILNTGYLPTISANTGVSLHQKNNSTSYRDSITVDINGIQTTALNAGINASYVIFDGMYRKYNFSKLQEQYKLSELEVRQLIENTLYKLYTSYFNIASLTENIYSLNQSLAISEKRLQRFKYNAEYGQSTQLDVLNAQVDKFNDSINLLNYLQDLDNAKRDMNVILGRDISTIFAIDTFVNYTWNISKDSLLKLTEKNNVSILKADQNIVLNELNVKLAKANLLPTINLTGNYYINSTGYDENSLFDLQRNIGPSIELGLSWNIFDGGRSLVNIQNSKVLQRNGEIEKILTSQKIERDVFNAWNSYKNALFILEVQKTNLKTSIRNFNRTEEQFKLGQLGSVEFRQAQLNFLNAQLKHNTAKYTAKINEVKLYQLSGKLMDMPY